MIDKTKFNKLKKHYGQCSSWAIWQEVGKTPKSNTGDITIFDDENICDKLNDKYVFVGLNVSSTPDTEPWKNFHSDSPYQNDYKLRYALIDTKFWGSYMTDIIKDCPLPTSSEVRKYLKKNPQKVDESIETFKQELNCLSDQHPVIIAMGNDAFKILDKKLGKPYKIVNITHYAYRISKEKYKDNVLNALKGY